MTSEYPRHREIAPATAGQGHAADAGRVMPRGFSGPDGAARTAILHRLKRQDQSVTSSTTLVDATDLSFAMRPNETYSVEVFLDFLVDPTPLFKWQLTLPSGAAFDGWAMSYNNAGTPAVFHVQQGTAYLPQFTTRTTAVVFGRVLCGSTAGVFQVQFAQLNSNAIATILYAKSYIRAERLSVG